MLAMQPLQPFGIPRAVARREFFLARGRFAVTTCEEVALNEFGTVEVAIGGDDDIELMIPTDDASRIDPALIMSSASTCPIPAPNFSSRASIQDEVNSGEYGIKTSAMPSYSEMLAARRATGRKRLAV